MFRVVNTIHGIVATEKARVLMNNKLGYVFKVSLNSTKETVKKAVESLFNTKVVSVNIIRVKAKSVRFKGIDGKTSAYKKAFVRISSGAIMELNSST